MIINITIIKIFTWLGSITDNSAPGSTPCAIKFSLKIGACPSAANLLKPFNKTFPISTCVCICNTIIRFKNMATVLCYWRCLKCSKGIIYFLVAIKQ